MQVAAESPSPSPDEIFMEEVLRELRARVQKQQFATWFCGLRLLSLGDDEVEFGVPSGFVRDWLNRNYLDVVAAGVKAADADKDRRVKLSVSGAETGSAGARGTDVEGDSTQPHSAASLVDDLPISSADPSS
jgi:chromosomal replication initiation ATPase DnaA